MTLLHILVVMVVWWGSCTVLAGLLRREAAMHEAASRRMSGDLARWLIDSADVLASFALPASAAAGAAMLACGAVDCLWALAGRRCAQTGWGR